MDQQEEKAVVSEKNNNDKVSNVSVLSTNERNFICTNILKVLDKK